MKIDKVSFDNINSLGGHFELDLAHPTLTDAGIFVITGPTGVGKTTLLDAICYAIYGCTARQPKLSATSNEIMTHGARYCRAEAWVEKDGTRYLFTCEQRRKKTRVAGADPYTMPQRSVSRVEPDGSATLLANKVREVEQWAESLMKFPNFTRCMMLAQGEFARFLKDNAAGRSEALATITGTEIYQRIGEKVQERVASLKAHIQQVALHEVLGAEERRRLEESLAAAETGLAAAREKLEGLDAALAWLEAVAKAVAARTDCAARLQHAREAADSFAQDGQAARIDAAGRALQILPLEQAADAAARTQQQAEAQLARERDWLAANPGKTEQEAAGKAAGALAEQEPAITRRLTFLANEVRPLEERIAQAGIRRQAAEQTATARRSEAEQAQQTASLADKALQNAAHEQERAEAHLRQLAPDAALAETLPAIRQRLEDWAACPQAESSLPAAADIAACAAAWQREYDGLLAGASREELPQQLAARETLLAAQGRHETAARQLADAAQAEAAAKAVLDTLPPIEEARQALDSAQQRAELAYKIQDAGQKLAELYREFRAGKLPCCPCCGSPVPHERPVQADSVLDEARAQMKHAQQELRLRQQRQEEARTAWAAAASAHTAERKSTDQAAQECATALRRLGWENTPTDLAGQVETLRRNIATLAELDTRRAELDKLEKLAACRTALHQALAAVTMETPATLPAARTLIGTLESRLQSRQEAEKQTAAAAGRRALAEERLTHARAALAERQQHLSTAETAAAQARATETRLRAELARLWPNGPARQAEETAHRQLKALQDTAAATAQAWHQLQRQQEAHRALAQAAETQLPHLREEQAQTGRKLAQALRRHGFADRAACAAARLEPQTLDTLRQQREALAQAIAEAEGAYRHACGQEAELRAAALTADSAETLAATRAAQATILHQQDELATTLRAQIQADELAHRANAEKEAQIAGTRQQLEHWRRLYDILGNSRESFKKYAQRITFNLLLVQANAQLRRLSDRYILIQDTNEELGLLVLDRYQDNPKGRSCSNLSGGESFIVSLALALGLSRMAGETRIDTLFLDEGFGTLDADALENVLDCLQSLRAGGKLIGIISHVEALKERIPVNIELLPLGASGLSTMAAHEAVVARPGLG